MSLVASLVFSMTNLQAFAGTAGDKPKEAEVNAATLAAFAASEKDASRNTEQDDAQELSDQAVPETKNKSAAEARTSFEGDEENLTAL